MNFPGVEDAWMSFAAEPVEPAERVDVVERVRWFGVEPSMPLRRGRVVEPVDVVRINGTTLEPFSASSSPSRRRRPDDDSVLS